MYFEAVMFLPPFREVFKILLVTNIIQMNTLKQRINDKGLKVSWIAEKINIPKATLYAYLNDLRDMPQDVSDKIKYLIK